MALKRKLSIDTDVKNLISVRTVLCDDNFENTIKMGNLFELKIQLLDVEPAVYRIVLIPEDLPLLDLHAVLQGAMGWNGSHMFAFEIRGNRYAVKINDSPFDQDDEKNVAGVICKDVFAKSDKAKYHYDFGDDWWHEIGIIDHRVQTKSDKPPRCIGGENPCPPDDSGGPWGWADMQEILNDESHPDREEIIEWLDDFDLGPFNKQASNRQIKTALKNFAPLFKDIRAGTL